MVRKIIIMYSFLLCSISIFLMSDIYASQMIYSTLDSLASTMCYYISKSKGITESIKTFVKKEANAEIICANEDCSSVKIGDIYFFKIQKEFKGIILNRTNNLITVKRSLIIGEY